MGIPSSSNDPRPCFWTRNISEPTVAVPCNMRFTLAHTTATLSLGCTGCEAFHANPTSSSSWRIRSSQHLPSRLAWTMRSEATAEAQPNTTNDSRGVQGGDGAVSSYPGPIVPRVGGAMPEQRPSWFRVPAPGGKHTKVQCSSTDRRSRHCRRRDFYLVCIRRHAVRGNP